MNGSDTIGVSGQGVNRGLRIVPDHGCHLVFQRIDGGRQDPGQVGFHGFPQPLERSELRALGRQEQADDIGRDQQRLGLMATAILPHQQIQGVLRGLSQLMQEEVKVDGIQVRSLQETAVPGAGFDGAIQRNVLALVRYWPDRRYPAHGQASTVSWKPAKAAFILAKNADRMLGSWVSRGLDLSPCGRQASRARLLKALDLCKVCFSVICWARAAWPARWSGRTCAPFYRRATRPIPDRTMAKGLCNWQPRGAAPSAHDALAAWPKPRAQACLEPWQWPTSGPLPRAHRRPASALQYRDAPPGGVPRGGGYGPAASGAETAPVSAGVCGHRAQRSGAV